MIKKVSIIFFFTIFFLNNSISEEIKIVYVDIDKIINSSAVGVDVLKKLDDLNKKNIVKYEKQQKKLKDKEQEIIQQKNITSKNDFDIKVADLKKKIALYKSEASKSKNDIIKKKKESSIKIFNILKEILAEYASKNSITFILKKSNIIIGKSELDITKEIMNTINKKIKTINLD